MCNFYIDVKRLTNLIEELDTYHRDIKQFFSPTLIQHEPWNKNTIHTLKKRAPLEFVGWINRKLFGIMDADDREQLGAEISKLYERQSNISRLEANQTHIIRANLEQIHNKIETNTREVKTIHHQTMKLLSQLKELENLTKTEMYTRAIVTWATEFEQSVDLTIDMYKTLINAIDVTSRGHLHPLLLTHGQLQELLDDIATQKSSHQFLWGTKSITPEYLFAVSQTSVATINGRLVIVLKFPLTDGENFSHYRIHSLPMKSSLHNNFSSYAFIKPIAENIFISRDVRNYFFAEETYIKNCKRNNELMLCYPDIPISTNSAHDPCEYSLLIRPTSQILKSCAWTIAMESTPFWKKLKSTDEWLFSTIEPLTVRVVCDENPIGDIKLTNAGIFSLHGKCTAYTADRIIYGVKKIFSDEAYTYSPNLNFNLTLLLPQIAPVTKTVLDTLSEDSEEKIKISSWANSKESLSLQEIENTFQGIAEQRKETQLTQTYVASGIIGNILLFFMLYLIFRYCIPSCIHSCSNRNNVKLVKSLEHLERQPEINTLPLLQHATSVPANLSSHLSQAPPPPPLPASSSSCRIVEVYTPQNIESMRLETLRNSSSNIEGVTLPIQGITYA